MGEITTPFKGGVGGGSGLGSDSLSPVGSGGAPSSPSHSSRKSDETSNAGLTAAASHQAMLHAGVNPSTNASPAPEQGGRIEPLGTLHVGDRYASLQQNSPETAQAAGTGVAGKATLNLTVPQGPSSEPAATSTPSAPKKPEEVTTREFSFLRFSSDNRQRRFRSKNEEENNRDFMTAYLQEVSNQPAARRVGKTANPEIAPAPAAGPETQRYIFNVYDVHDMGGTPSRLSILDAKSGDVLGSYDLSPGDSSFVADLPSGDYTIEAQSGSRSGNAPNAGPDDLDNFRVEVSSAGPTPSGEE